MTKRIIYKPLDGETKPVGAVDYHLPINGYVFDVLTYDGFSPASGIVLYDSAAGIVLPEPPAHQFAGWEI
jgi:hypothetical protein